MPITPGKIRGLQRTANADGIFTVVAIDHGDSLMAGPLPGYQAVVEAKSSLLAALAPHASAVLLDPVYGLGPAVIRRLLPGDVGLLLAVEDADYTDPAGEKRTALLEGWSVAKIKRSGADAVKLFFYHDPDAGEVTEAQEKLVAQIVRECRQFDLPLFAEPLSYNIRGPARRRVVIETARRIDALGVDVLKLEFPIDIESEPNETVWADACEELSDVCRVPWVLLSAGVDYTQYARQVAVACRAGASGFLAGRAIWKEAVELAGEKRTAFLERVCIPRLQELNHIAAQLAKPWTAFETRPLAVPDEGWYRDYPEFEA